jgi:ribosomal protein S18 acetylase RimI-like enzyme
LTIQIRGAGPADAFEIADLHIRSRRARLPYLPELHTDENVRSYFTSVVLPSCSVLVAVLAGRIVGFAAVADGDLEHLYIDPDHLRTGIGSALLAQVKVISPGGLVLHVFQRNDDARSFYRRHGFLASSFHSGTGNEENEPDMVMTWAGIEQAQVRGT